MGKYESVPLREVFDGISALLGSEPVVAGDPEHVSMVAHLARHLTRGWLYDFWPEWTPAEQRAYREVWDELLAYVAGSEVLFGDKYWGTPVDTLAGVIPGEAGQAITDGAGAPMTDVSLAITDGSPSVWEELTQMARYVALEQPGQTPIGAVARVCRRNPRVYPQNPGELKFDLTDLGIMPDSRAGVTVWVEFRLRVPKFSAFLWLSAKAYAVDAVVYDDATGDCYKALQAGSNHPVTDAAWWERVAFPARLKSFVETACYADALRGDGQTGKAMAEQGNAETFLLQAYDDAFPGQGQFSSASYSTR